MVKLKVKRMGIFSPGDVIVALGFIVLLVGALVGYTNLKGPFSEAEISQAQRAALRFQNGELSVKRGTLLATAKYFFVGEVYTVKTEAGSERLLSFVSPLKVPAVGDYVEWVGVENYCSSITSVYKVPETFDAEIISLERIAPKNNANFYCVVRSYQNDDVRRIIIDAPKLDKLTTLNSVKVTYSSPQWSSVELVPNQSKVARGFVRDIGLTTKISSLELERNFDHQKYPYFISVAPGENPKYTWTFYLTLEQYNQVALGNVVDIEYKSEFPTSIKVAQSSVDQSTLNKGSSEKTP